MVGAISAGRAAGGDLDNACARSRDGERGLQVRTGLTAGGKWIRTIGTPPNFFGRPSIPAQIEERREPGDYLLFDVPRNGRSGGMKKVLVQRGFQSAMAQVNQGVGGSMYANAVGASKRQAPPSTDGASIRGSLWLRYPLPGIRGVARTRHRRSAEGPSVATGHEPTRFDQRQIPYPCYPTTPADRVPEGLHCARGGSTAQGEGDPGDDQGDADDDIAGDRAAKDRNRH